LPLAAEASLVHSFALDPGAGQTARLLLVGTYAPALEGFFIPANGATPVHVQSVPLGMFDRLACALTVYLADADDRRALTILATL